jgi:hypothetical protein
MVIGRQNGGNGTTQNFDVYACPVSSCTNPTIIGTPAPGHQGAGSFSQLLFSVDGSHVYWVETRLDSGNSSDVVVSCALPTCATPIDLDTISIQGSAQSGPSHAPSGIEVLAGGGFVVTNYSADNGNAMRVCPAAGPSSACAALPPLQSKTSMGSGGVTAKLLAIDGKSLLYAVNGPSNVPGNSMVTSSEVQRCTLPACSDATVVISDVTRAVAQASAAAPLGNSNTTPYLQLVATSTALFWTDEVTTGTNCDSQPRPTFVNQPGVFACAGKTNCAPSAFRCGGPQNAGSQLPLLNGQGFDGVMLPASANGTNGISTLAADQDHVYFVAHGPFGGKGQLGDGNNTDEVWAILATSR